MKWVPASCQNTIGSIQATDRTVTSKLKEDKSAIQNCNKTDRKLQSLNLCPDCGVQSLPNVNLLIQINKNSQMSQTVSELSCRSSLIATAQNHTSPRAQSAPSNDRTSFRGAHSGCAHICLPTLMNIGPLS